MDWLVYWYIDDFIELSDQQEKVVDANLATWLAWHKETELPKYIEHFSELSGDIQRQQLTVEKMDYHQQKAADHWLRLKAKIIPDLVEMSPMLSQEQIDSMFKEIDKINEEKATETKELLAKTPEKRKSEFIKKNKRNLKRWLGKLNNEQERLVENTYGEYYSNAELWLEYRVRYQTELHSLLKSTDRGDTFKIRLNKLLMEPEVFRGNTLNQRNSENSRSNKVFLLAADALATKKQRKHLLNEITDFVDDLNDLVR